MASFPRTFSSAAHTPLPLVQARAQRDHWAWALMSLDPGLFRRMTDTQGHARGDVVLKEIA